MRPIKIKIDRELFIHSFNSAFKAAAKHDVRIYLTGVLIELVDSKMVVVGCNGHWLFKVGLKSGLTGKRKLRQLVVCREHAELFGKVFKNRTPRKIITEETVIDLTITGDHILVEDDGLSLKMQLLTDVKYPDYDSVIPKDLEKRKACNLVGLNADYILSGVSALRPFLSGFNRSGPCQLRVGSANETVVLVAVEHPNWSGMTADSAMCAIMPMRL